MFTKWPFIFPVPDQQSVCIVKLLVKQIIPFCDVPETLLSDRGANLLSHLMLDVCEKLNTTAYDPQGDGVVERFNRTLKAMLRKHSQDSGKQWDRYLPAAAKSIRATQKKYKKHYDQNASTVLNFNQVSSRRDMPMPS